MVNEKAITVKKAEAIEAVEQRIAESDNTDHAAHYAFIAATKPQLFGPVEFAECPQCDRRYRLFNNPLWKGDQSVCQACADENFAFTRDKMQKIEHAYAEAELRRLNSEPAPEEITGPFHALSGATT